VFGNSVSANTGRISAQTYGEAHPLRLSFSADELKEALKQPDKVRSIASESSLLITCHQSPPFGSRASLIRLPPHHMHTHVRPQLQDTPFEPLASHACPLAVLQELDRFARSWAALRAYEQKVLHPPTWVVLKRGHTLNITADVACVRGSFECQVLSDGRLLRLPLMAHLREVEAA
jgi:hypothetical protein